MKVIITEEMLKQVVLAEAESWAKGSIDFGKDASTPSANISNVNMNQLFNNYMNALINPSTEPSYNSNGQGVMMPQKVQNIGNWDVNKSISYLMRHTGTKSQHNCALYVENALVAGGFPKISCTENGGTGWAHSLHYNGILASHGFEVVGSGQLAPRADINGNLQPGDIMVMDTGQKYYKQNGGIGYRVHTAMWTGSQWISDFKQNHANVYGIPAVYWIYRYKGNTKQQA